MSIVIEVKLDDANRILIPAVLQRRLGLEPGMTLVVEEEAEGVALHVQPESPLLVDKDGVLVARVEPIEDITHVVRQERERSLADKIISP